MLFCLSNHSPHNSWAVPVFQQSCYGSLVVHHCLQECALQNPPTEMMRQLFACVLFCNLQYCKPLEKHRYSTTIACKHYITIATRFQQKIALKQSYCLTVAQTAAKRSIRADPSSARQSKKKCRIFCGLEGVVSTRDY